MRKIKITVLLSVLIMIFSACTKQPGPDIPPDNPPTPDEKYKTDAAYYFDFEQNDMLDERVSGLRYDINYVYADAKDKPSENVKLANGVNGYAMLFDGYSTYSDTCPISADGSLSVSVWVAPRAYDTRYDGKAMGIVSCLDDGGGFELGLGNYGSWYFKIRTNKGTFQITGEDSVIDLYKWNYITAVFDGSARKLYLYKNGEIVAQSNTLGDKVLPCSSPLRVGCITKPETADKVFTANIFSGLIDELEIYTSALSGKKAAEKYEMFKSNAEKLDVYGDLWLDSEILADDRYAPQYHLRTAQNWQNETYAFFFYNGVYHAFCQQNPIGPYYTEGQRWGHFVSVDLVHWQELVPALLPEQNGIDNNQVFSGGAAIDKNGNPVLFYTGVNHSNKNLNLISTATAADTGDKYLTNWVKSGKVVVEQGDIGTYDSFRDPFIYKEGDTYFMLVGSQNASTGNGAIYCYKAVNDGLTEWRFLGETYSGDRFTYKYLGTCYELPNLFKLSNSDGTKTKYMLMFSPINGSNNGVYYLLGSFDTKTGRFTPEREEPYLLDYAPTSQVLCPSGFYDTKLGRNLLITMSRTGMSEKQRHDSGWSNVMTLIKEITLGEDGLPRFSPIDEYGMLEDEELVSAEGTHTFSAINNLLSTVSGDMLKIEVEIELNGDSKVGMYVKYDADGRERVDISYTPQTNVLCLDSTKSSTAMRNNGIGRGAVDIGDENVKLTVYIDRAMVEVYMNGRNQATCFAFNQSETSTGIMLYLAGGLARVKSIRVCEMQSAFE